MSTNESDDLPVTINYALIFIFLIGLFWAFTSFFSYGFLVWAKEPEGALENKEITCTYVYMFGTRDKKFKAVYREDCPFFQKFR